MKKLGFRIWLWIVILIFSLIAIFPISNLFQKGVLITSVDQNSTAFEEGLRQGQIITSIDGKTITSLDEFTAIINNKFPSNTSQKTIITTKDSEIIFYSSSAPEIIVSKIPKTNIKTGLDLAGGARALVKAEDRDLSSEEVNNLVTITENRLNVYGLSDIKVSSVSDLSRNHFMKVEIAGATPKDLRDMIENQGEFEARIKNQTVFIGGNKDISSVCRNDATCAGIETCNKDSSGTYYCTFRFVIYLSEEAAKRHADITNGIGTNISNPGYLSEPLELYLDGNLVDTLLISEDLKGQVTTQIAISGSGTGTTQEDAYNSAEEQMHKLQTVLITGSLPYKLEIVKLDTISPLLGKEFIRLILIAGILALLTAAVVVFIRYRDWKAAGLISVISLSEIIIVLGIASFIDWNLDLAGIAGILATIGTGFDDQIVILDEANNKEVLTLKQRIKRAFGIIFGAYSTVIVSLLPLLWAGAGLLKGFAITTIIGVSVGVLITRPAFSHLVQRFKE